MKNTYVAIMAGGVGSRFWPGSREARPKQFLDMLGVGKSLIRLTFERFLNLCPASNIYIVTNAAYKDLILDQLPEITEDQVLCEPSRNNTAPCIAYTALKLAAADPDANMIVAPSDHVILKESVFLDKIRLALDFASKNDALLTLGIEASRPDTGYGYIQYESIDGSEVCRVKRFAEKPALDQAEAYLASGDYVWNAGIFIWNVQSVLSAYKQYASEIYDILAAGNAVYNTGEEQAFIDSHYPTTPSISVDFAIMENAQNVYTIPAEFGWSDLGTWASLHHECPKDNAGNVVQSETALIQNTSNCLIRVPKGKLVVLDGLDDYMVIDEGDVLLIYPKSREQEIKQVRGAVEKQFGDRFV
ncbi:MAG: mannose-1-phosphate guanylyltransferase [Saprospiraceae bacterium]